MKGPDNNLYASVWDYPSNEGLYRSSNNGGTWDLLTSVPSGNNIFACAVMEGSPNTIFAGTGQGIYRSLDNGGTWAYANSGLPSGLLIRSLAISPDGAAIIAGSVNGAYVSFDNGDSWDKITGDGENEIISSVTIYEDPESGEEMTDYILLLGSELGNMYAAYSVALYATAFFCATILNNAGITRMMVFNKPGLKIPIFFASLYAATGGYMAYAVTSFKLWQAMMSGLPPSTVISVFFGYFIATNAVVALYLAMFNNSKAANSGTEIYKTTFDLTVGIEGQPLADQRVQLFQNIPNPFKDQTRINFHLNEAGNATLRLFDMAGNEVRTLIDGMIRQGRHSIQVAKEGLRSGMYYYVLESNGQVQTKKLVLQ
jgi:hypothetical protein